MSAYIEFAKKAFMKHMVYRFNYLIGILNTCLQIFIFWCIYKALYHGAVEVDGITFLMVTTNFVLSLGLSNAFVLNDFFIQAKVRDGTIANELLRPINFKMRILSENLGNAAFQLLFMFLPVLAISAAIVGIQAPKSVGSLLLFVISAMLGYLVLWNISFIVQMTSFWLVNVWSISTIKNVFVNVLSGAMIPLWFMPDAVVSFVRFTPFDSIYFTPIRLYLGDIQIDEILFIFTRQVFWICILYMIGEMMWRKGQRKLVVQGG